MNKLLLPLAASLLLGAPLAFAASTTELKVIGKITPSACTPTLNGASEGVIDHGKISFSDLNETGETKLPEHTLTLSVNCGAAIAFALQAIDNQPGTSPAPEKYGLGFINGDQPLGYYKLTLRNPFADNVAVQTIASEDRSIWYREKFVEPQLYMSVGTLADETQPLPTQELTVDLVVETFINRADGLDLSNEVPINGSATIEVIYL